MSTDCKAQEPKFQCLLVGKQIQKVNEFNIYEQSSCLQQIVGFFIERFRAKCNMCIEIQNTIQSSTHKKQQMDRLTEMFKSTLSQNKGELELMQQLGDLLTQLEKKQVKAVHDFIERISRIYGRFCDNMSKGDIHFIPRSTAFDQGIQEKIHGSPIPIHPILKQITRQIDDDICHQVVKLQDYQLNHMVQFPQSPPQQLVSQTLSIPQQYQQSLLLQVPQSMQSSLLSQSMQRAKTPPNLHVQLPKQNSQSQHIKIKMRKKPSLLTVPQLLTYLDNNQRLEILSYDRQVLRTLGATCKNRQDLKSRMYEDSLNRNTCVNKSVQDWLIVSKKYKGQNIQTESNEPSFLSQEQAYAAYCGESNTTVTNRKMVPQPPFPDKLPNIFLYDKKTRHSQLVESVKQMEQRLPKYFRNSNTDRSLSNNNNDHFVKVKFLFSQNQYQT